MFVYRQPATIHSGTTEFHEGNLVSKLILSGERKRDYRK